MDPLTIAAAIAATQKIVEGAKNISDIAHGLDDIFHAQEQHKKNKRKPNQPKTRMQQILRMRSGDEGYDDDTSISAVANDVLEEKKLNQQIDRLSSEIDRKWGKGTWQIILDEREKRIKDRKEAIKKRRANEHQKAEEHQEQMKKIATWAGQIVLVISLVSGLIWFLIWAADKGGST